MADRIAAHLTIRGEWRFASARDTFRVGAGLLLVCNNEKSWDFEVDDGTRSLLFMLPAADIRRSLPSSQALMVEQDTPAARLLLLVASETAGRGAVRGRGGLVLVAPGGRG